MLQLAVISPKPLFIQCGIINWEVASAASILLNAAAQACLEILVNFYLTNAIQNLSSNLESINMIPQQSRIYITIML